MVEQLALNETVPGPSPGGRTSMEKLPTNRLIEDKTFLDRILDKILDELESLSRTFDDQMADLGYGNIWEERINRRRVT